MALGGAFELVEAVLEFMNGLLQPCGQVAQLFILAQQLLIRRGIHTTLASDGRGELVKIIVIRKVRVKRALNNHKI